MMIKMKYILLLILIPVYLFSFSSSKPTPKINSLKVYEIDTDNKLSLLDTNLVYSQNYNDEYKYSDSAVILELIEVSYPNVDLLYFLKASEIDKMDSTYDDGVTTYKFYSWCKKDTVDWETDDKGKIVYDIECSNCKIQDIIKTDSKNRLIHYSFISLGHESAEDYRFDDNDKLAEINSFKGHFLFFYDDLGRIDYIKEDYQNLGNLVETMGNSLKREIIYKFKYE